MQKITHWLWYTQVQTQTILSLGVYIASNKTIFSVGI